MFLAEGRISTVVATNQTVGPLNLGDPEMRRNVGITGAIAMTLPSVDYN
jgi:hypothetical protein